MHQQNIVSGDPSALNADTLAVDALDKVFGALESRPTTVKTLFRGAFIITGVCIGLPLLWVCLSFRNLLRRQRRIKLPKQYVLFLPNLNQNLATMAAVVSGLRNVAVVFCCPHTVSRQRLVAMLNQDRDIRTEIIPLHWVDYVSFRHFPQYCRFAGKLLRHYLHAKLPAHQLIIQICKFSLYSILCIHMRDIAFSKILSSPPSVIISARPKSHYGNLPFLHAARLQNIPAYYLAHTHIDASSYFQYQVYRPTLFTAFFLFSDLCKQISEQNFRIDGELIVTGDPTLDHSMSNNDNREKSQTIKPGIFRVMYAASVFYGQDSMCDLVEVLGAIPKTELIIKTRPPGNNSGEITRILKGYDTRAVHILDHATTGPIETILHRADIIVGSVTNSVINAVLRGVPSVVYINQTDMEKIRKRTEELFPYEKLGIPVITQKSGLKAMMIQLTDTEYRSAFLHRQQQMTRTIYPNVDNKPAVEVISSRIRTHLQTVN